MRLNLIGILIIPFSLVLSGCMSRPSLPRPPVPIVHDPVPPGEDEPRPAEPMRILEEFSLAYPQPGEFVVNNEFRWDQLHRFGESGFGSAASETEAPEVDFRANQVLVLRPSSGWTNTCHQTRRPRAPPTMLPESTPD